MSWVRRLVAAAEERKGGENAISESVCWYVLGMAGACPRPPYLFFEVHLLKYFAKLPFQCKMVVHGPKPRITFLGSTAAGLVSPEWGNFISSAGRHLCLLVPGDHVQSSVGVSEMGTRCCSAVAEVQNHDVSWFACCHISSGIMLGQLVHNPSANPPVAVVSCQWVSCLPAHSCYP